MVYKESPKIENTRVSPPRPKSPNPNRILDSMLSSIGLVRDEGGSA